MTDKPKQNPFQTVSANDPDWLDKVARAARYGSGIAVDFSEVRPKGEPIKPDFDPAVMWPSEYEPPEPYVKPLHPLQIVGVWTLAVAFGCLIWGIIFGFLGADYANKIAVNVASVLGLFGGFTAVAGWGLSKLRGDDK